MRFVFKLTVLGFALFAGMTSVQAANLDNPDWDGYKSGIKTMVDKQALRVKIDHLQTVDATITANDQALLDHYKEELAKY